MSLCKKYCKKIISPIVGIYSYRMVKSELPLKKFWNFKLKTIKIRKLFFWEVFIKFFMVLFSFSLPFKREKIIVEITYFKDKKRQYPIDNASFYFIYLSTYNTVLPQFGSLILLKLDRSFHFGSPAN